MTAFIALLRAVNVGGTGKLPMTTLKQLCEDAGFSGVRTYIASGNVIFASRLGETKIKSLLERGLHAYAGKPVGVVVRTAAEMADVAADNPFPEHPANRTVAIFLDHPPPPDAIGTAVHVHDERLAPGRREIYVAYGSHMGTSKLRIPAAKDGTARNLNTVAKLAALAAERSP